MKKIRGMKVIKDLQVGDRVRIFEHYIGWGRFITATVIKIYEKKGYNMYLCEYKNGQKTCITDHDVYLFKTAQKI